MASVVSTTLILMEGRHSKERKGALLRALLNAKRLDQVRGEEEVSEMMTDLLMSPVLKRVLCNPTNFQSIRDR